MSKEIEKFTKGHVVMDKIAVGFISFRNDNNQATYLPKKDITSHEVGLLFPLFLTGTIPSSFVYDYIGYIKSNNLERHFKIEEIKE